MPWLKQTDEPLYPEVVWSRPENRLGAGKLLIVGGNSHAIAAPVNAYSLAMQAGAGSCRVLMPDSVQKAFGKIVQEAYFAPSTPSGSFSKKALDELTLHSSWADCVLLAGDFGRNSETAVLLENFILRSDKPLVLTHDAGNNIYSYASKLLQRENTLLVLSFAQMQKLLAASNSRVPLQFSYTMAQTAEAFLKAAEPSRAGLLTRQNGIYFYGQGDRVLTSKSKQAKVWRVETAARAGVWWLQNPEKQFEAVATSLIEKVE